MAREAENSPPRSQRVLHGIAGGYAVIWVVAAIAPHNRFDWLLENLLVFLWVGLLLASRRAVPLSNLSYGLIAAFLTLHTIGSHYTYSLTPIGFWIQDLLALERNHYDRVVHFCFGLLLAYPLFEALSRVLQGRTAWLHAMTLSVILAFSNLYEIIEWAAAEVIEPEAALAFLGTQGDVFDAQKDAGLALIGGGIALSALALSKPQ